MRPLRRWRWRFLPAATGRKEKVDIPHQRAARAQAGGERLSDATPGIVEMAHLVALQSLSHAGGRVWAVGPQDVDPDHQAGQGGPSFQCHAVRRTGAAQAGRSGRRNQGYKPPDVGETVEEVAERSGGFGEREEARVRCVRGHGTTSEAG